MPKTYRVLVTGDRDDWSPTPCSGASGSVEWKSVPVLQYERLPIKAGLLDQLSAKPAEWIVFTSPRAVRFWAELLLETGNELPPETQVACLGERTASVAAEDGFSVDFRPREPGTEGFLEEFERGNRLSSKPSILIPAAEGGRTKIKDRLRQLGCEVTALALYRTLPKTGLGDTLTEDELGNSDAIVFTSPSSVDALLACFRLPESLQVIAIGGFTGRHLEGLGYVRPKQLPNGDFSRIGEVLCRP